MKFIKTAIASITLSAISGSVFATTYFSLQEKSDSIQQVRTEANAAARLNRFIILKYNNDRANFNQQDWDFYHKTEETLENANARIAEIMRAPVVAMPSRPNPPTPTVTPLMQPHMVPNKVPTPVANNVLSNVVIPAATLTAAQKTPTPLTPAIPPSVFGTAYIDAKNNQSVFTPPPRAVIPAATLTAAQKTPTPLTPAIPPSVFGAAYIDAKNNQSVFTPPPRTVIPAATLTVAQKTPTPVAQQVPSKIVIPATSLTAAQKTPTPLTPAIPPSVFGAAYIDAKNNQSVFTPPPRTVIPAATLTVAQKTPTPVVQPGVAMANLTPQKLNGSQHPTNEHHISDAPVKQPYNIPVQTATHFVSLTPSVKPQGVPTPKYNNIALVGSHLDSNVTDAQRLRSILENAPKAVNGVDGKKGAKGDTGATGAQGVTGIKGRDGINGHNGKDGVTTTVTRMQVDTVTQTKVANNSQAITTTAQDLQATKQTLQAMNNNTSQQFKSLRDEVDNNKKQANAGISGAMAMAGLPQVQTDQRVMFSAGGATYNGESALAVGASVNFNSHVIGKVSFSDDTANNMGASVGIGMGF
ncbi:YadA C-terminal domain-containing protein [Enterobacter cloacae]|uniref:YadA C-terminal domain-containing protein n=1 Tax=Enterobacter cloacae TaxID=550 RepID=UPI002874186F|nr:YadA-like family protein [Enterobacter cloacae]MDR9930779.1 YadA-like family protein [Enterobacter cloacae subsp. dissolvens]